MTVTALILAAAWDDFFKILPFIIVLLVWVINQFAGKVQPPQMPPKRVPPVNPAAPPRPPQAAPQGQQPLQAEIEEFLRQAQALREGRPVPPRNQPVATQPPGAAQQAAPAAGPRSPQRPPRRAPQPGAKTSSQRPMPPAPLAPQAETPEPPRESVAQYVSEHIDSAKFNQRASSLSNIQKDVDDFQKHMQRVFDRDIGKRQEGPLGMFEAAGAAAAAASAAAATSATASAGGAESATAPIATHKAASNISLFLAGRKNIRDAIILSEILRRPEDCW